MYRFEHANHDIFIPKPISKAFLRARNLHQ